jgi:hypothetical protein
MTFFSSYEDCPIAGTFCRMRWFLRYARGEGRLCRRSNPTLIERLLLTALWAKEEFHVPPS